ncbi:hypothetical protein LINPERPRIM_LOCUS9080 [Linum perenne]
MFMGMISGGGSRWRCELLGIIARGS